jgi:hypothetical protein
VEGGFVAGVSLGLVPFGGVGQQVLDAAEVLPHGTPEARRGLAVGQIVGGIITLVGGLTGEVAGGLATTTGIGAAVGVSTIAVSTTLVVGGVGNIAAGIRGLMTTGSGSGAGKGDLHRPYIRKSTRKEIEAAAPRDATGRPIDPNTGKPISGKPDVGHKPGNEFRREKAAAKAEGLSQKGFNERMNDPSKYHLEDPSSNRSHTYEQKP